MKSIASYSKMQEIALTARSISSDQNRLGRNPIEFFDRSIRQDVFRRLLDYLIRAHHALFTEISITEKRMALDLGISLRSVAKAIKELKRHGLISYVTHYGNPLYKGRKMRRGDDGKYRNIWIRSRRNVYTISPILFEPSIASQLTSILPGLSEKIRKLAKHIAIALLFVNSLHMKSNKECQMEYCTTNKLSLYKDSHSLYKSIYHSREVIYTSLLRRPKVNDVNHATTSPPTLLRPQSFVGQAKTMESDMSDVQISNIILDKVTPMLHLTPRGQAFLSSFHDGALDHGLTGVPILGSSSTGGIPSGETPRDWDYRLFVNLCEYWTHRHKLPRYHDKTAALMKKYGCSSSDPFYHPAFAQPDLRPVLRSFNEVGSSGGQVTAPIPRSLPPAKRLHQKEIAQNPLLDAEFAAAFEVIKKKEQNRRDNTQIFIQKETF